MHCSRWSTVSAVPLLFFFFVEADFINLSAFNIHLKFFIPFVRFPWKDPNLLEQWLENLNLRDWHPKNLSVLCSIHFKEECFDRTGFRVSLQKGSIPTELGDPASCCIFCRRKRTCSSEKSFYK